MLESESSALPFGDGPLSCDKWYYTQKTEIMQVLFSKKYLSLPEALEKPVLQVSAP